MNQERVLTVYACVRASQTGEWQFPEIVARLAAIGVERYHADYTRLEKTFYFDDGESIVTTIPHDAQVVSHDFSAQAVEAAVRQSQRNEHTFSDFVRKTIAAGCVGYCVHIAGRHAVYFGRKGETHVEQFPNAPTTID
ncbi:MAG: DUF1398 family protein [Pirellulales bacterium]